MSLREIATNRRGRFRLSNAWPPKSGTTFCRGRSPEFANASNQPSSASLVTPRLGRLLRRSSCNSVGSATIFPRPRRKTSTGAPISSLPRSRLRAARSELAPDKAYAHFGLAKAYYVNCQRDRLRVEAERVIALNPGDMEAQGALGNWLAFGGDWDSGRRLAEAALTLAGPSAPTWWHQATAKGFYHKGEYEKAYQAFLLSYAEGSWLDLLHVVYTLPYLGRTEEAKARIPELIKLMPNMSVRLANQHYKMWCFDDDYIAKMDKALRMAGLRETADAPPTEALASKP